MHTWRDFGRVVAGQRPVISFQRKFAAINQNILESEDNHMEADTVYALIEKTRTNTTSKVVLPEDWPNLVTRIEREAAINIIKLEQKVFLNFISLVNRFYIYRKKNQKKTLYHGRK